MIELNYKEFGQGEPVVILHGLFGTLDNWQTIAKGLGEHFTVFTLDLPNHGRSPHTEGVVNYPTLADDVAHFMQEHWVYEARVIGHSLGGKVAMQLALNYPDLVKKLVVIDIAPKPYKDGHKLIFEALNNLNLETLADRKEAEKYLMDKLNNDVGTVQFLLKNLSRRPNTDGTSRENREGGGFEWKMNLSVLQRDYSHILKTVEGERFEKDTLFIRGGASDYVKDEDFKQIETLFSKATMTTIAGAGHWVHADKPKELFEVLIKFL